MNATTLPHSQKVPSSPGISTRYNPEVIAQKYSNCKIQVFQRWLEILVPITSFIIKLWWNEKTGQSPKKQRYQAIRLREILTRLGPAYIKVGQALSIRPDLLPSIYIEELAKLQDKLPPFSNELAYQFIQEELGKSPEEIYTELTEQPIAAGSLGQVYQAKLKTGEIVAVKVQRPNLAENIALDMYILRGIANQIQKHYGKIRSNVVAILDEFATHLFEEMDYIQEGKNAERFASLYGHICDIHVPRIYWEYTNSRVLTMEWIKGTKLTQKNSIQAQGINACYLVEVGVQCTLKQLLEDGFFHADPHPGNLLAMENGKLAYLDFGMMSEIKPHQRYSLMNVIIHILNQDFSDLVEDYIQLEFLPVDAEVAPISSALGKLFNNTIQSNIAEFNFEVIIQQLSEIMYQYSFQVPAYYTLIIRSLVALEGIAMSIDPQFKVLVSAYPYVVKRLLTDPDPELKITLNNLLFKGGSFRWHRLETLLRNLHDNKYNFNTTLEQGAKFLLSEKGEIIRIYLADEVVKIVENFSKSLQYKIIDIFGIYSKCNNEKSAVSIEPESIESLQRIWVLLESCPSFNITKLIQVISEILTKPETHETGRYLINQLLQRSIKNLIVDFIKTPTRKNTRIFSSS